MFVLPSLHFINFFDINLYQYLLAAIFVYCKMSSKRSYWRYIYKDDITFEHKGFTNTLLLLYFYLITFHFRLIDTLD